MIQILASPLNLPNHPPTGYNITYDSPTDRPCEESALTSDYKILFAQIFVMSHCSCVIKLCTFKAAGSIRTSAMYTDPLVKGGQS